MVQNYLTASLLKSLKVVLQKGESFDPKKAQLNNMHNGREIKGLVVCYVMWLGPMKGRGLKTCARCKKR